MTTETLQSEPQTLLEALEACSLKHRRCRRCRKAFECCHFYDHHLLEPTGQQERLILEWKAVTR